MSLILSTINQIQASAAIPEAKDPQREKRIALILEHVRGKGRTRCADLMDVINASRSTTDEIITLLVNRGLLERAGWGHIKPAGT